MDSSSSTGFAVLGAALVGLSLTCCEAEPTPGAAPPQTALPPAHSAPAVLDPGPAMPKPAPVSAPRGEPHHAGPAPRKLGCHLVRQQELGRGLGAARLAARADGVWVASYARRQGKRWLARFQLVPGGQSVRALAELPLGASDAVGQSIPPAIAAGRSLWMASIDDRGALSLWPHADQSNPTAVRLATRVDRRFTPALRELDQDLALAAWTEGDATGMHVMAATVRDGHAQTHAVTPAGHGASAPRFIAGKTPAWLLMLDAHAGVSPLLTVRFSAAGVPDAARVERSVSQPYAPPSLFGVALAEQPVQVAYTAIGNAATAAVGIVDANSTLPPQPLLSGTGYAQLAVDAVLGPRHAVFTMDAPRTSEKSPALEVHVRVWNGKQAGAPLVLTAEGASLRRPAIAYDATRDLFALGALHEDGVRIYWLRCDA